MFLSFLPPPPPLAVHSKYQLLFVWNIHPLRSTWNFLPLTYTSPLLSLVPPNVTLGWIKLQLVYILLNPLTTFLTTHNSTNSCVVRNLLISSATFLFKSFPCVTKYIPCMESDCRESEDQRDWGAPENYNVSKQLQQIVKKKHCVMSFLMQGQSLRTGSFVSSCPACSWDLTWNTLHRFGPST